MTGKEQYKSKGCAYSRLPRCIYDPSARRILNALPRMADGTGERFSNLIDQYKLQHNTRFVPIKIQESLWREAGQITGKDLVVVKQ